MLKKLLLITAISTTALFSYEVGDRVDAEIAKQLNIKDEKVYVVDFFASWCASCKIELPLISALDKQLDKSKYKIIGVNCDKKINKGKDFVKKLNLPFDIVYDNKSKIISKFAPIGVPAIYYIKDLKVEKVIFGAVHNIDQKIQNDLKNIGE